MLYKQFVTWVWDGCSVAPLTDYINNPIYQELVDKDHYGENKRDERVYLDLKASSGYTNEAVKLERNDSKVNFPIVLKNAAAKKMQLTIRAHSIGEYFYILIRSGLTLRHKTYSISQQENDFLEWIGTVSRGRSLVHRW